MIKDNDFKNYQIDNRECRAFHFSPAGRWCQSFIIVWSPGYLMVVGDMGNLIMQLAALENFEAGMKWIANHAKPNNYYFMEKVQNYRQDILDYEATKNSLIESFSEMTAEDVKEYAENYISYELLDAIFDNELNGKYQIAETEIEITGDDIAERLKNYTFDEVDIEEINDCESIAYTYDWEFLNCRIEALREFAIKQLFLLGVQACNTK